MRASVPGLGLAVRVSAFDTVPYRKDERGRGVPEVPFSTYDSAFGLSDADTLDAGLDDSRELLRMLEAKNVRWVCVTAGSPYYCPHVQRPRALSARRRLSASRAAGTTAPARPRRAG